MRLFLTAATDITTARTVDGDHGRIETRTAIVSTDIKWLQKMHQWPGLGAIGMVTRVRETPEETTCETAHYLLSSALSPERFLEVIEMDPGNWTGS